MAEGLKRAARLAHQTKAPTYPADHKAAMRVPYGGSSCSTCRFVSENHNREAICTNVHFIRWHGDMKLPFPPDEYCSDWYEPQAGILGNAKGKGL